MKKISHTLAYFLPLAALFALAYFKNLAFLPDIGLFCIYALCLVVTPVLSVYKLPRLLRGFLYGLVIFIFSCGIPAAMVLGGQIGGTVLLAFGALFVSLLQVHRALPTETPDIAHLILRGLPSSRARRKLLACESFSFFFFYSNRTAALIGVWQLIISGAPTPSSLFSMAISVVLLGLLGYVLYLLLGAYRPQKPNYTPRKGHLVALIILSLCLILIFSYIYVGEAYTNPEPELAAALRFVQVILTPALLAIVTSFVLGLTLGYLLSFLGNRFFAVLCKSLLRLPIPVWAGLILLCLPEMPFASFISTALPLLLLSTFTTLESRAKLAPFRQFPPAGRRRVIVWPLFYRAQLSLLPYLAVGALYSSVLIHLASLLAAEPSAQVVLIAICILAVVTSILYVLSFFLKEAKHHE